MTRENTDPKKQSNEENRDRESNLKIGRRKESSKNLEQTSEQTWKKGVIAKKDNPEEKPEEIISATSSNTTKKQEPQIDADNSNEKKEPKINWTNATKSIGSRTAAIVTAIVGAAALGAAAWPVAAAAAGAIATAMIIDTAVVTYTKGLYKEAKYLDRHRRSSDKQSKMLEKYPNLAKNLKQDMYQPAKDGKSKNEKLSRNISEEQRNKENLLKAMAYNTLSLLSDIVEGVIARDAGQVVAALRVAATDAPETAASGELMSKQRENLRNYIDRERAKGDSPAYDNVYELRKAAREQKIQELTIQKMINDAEQNGFDLNNMTKEQARQVLQIKKHEVQKTEKSIRDSNNVIYNIRQFAKSFIQAHDEDSKFHDPKKLEELTPKIKETEIAPKEMASNEKQNEQHSENKTSKKTSMSFENNQPLLNEIAETSKKLYKNKPQEPTNLEDELKSSPPKEVAKNLSNKITEAGKKKKKDAAESAKLPKGLKPKAKAKRGKGI